MKTKLQTILAASLIVATAALAQLPAPPRAPAVPAPPTPDMTPPPAASEAPAVPASATPAPVASAAVDAPLVTPDPVVKIEVMRDRNASAGITATTNVDKNGLININFENAPLTEVVRAFTQLSGANIVLGTNGQDLVTMSMTQVAWEPALRAILDSVGKSLVLKSPGIYGVVNKSDAAAEPVTVEVVPLKYLMASTILPTVEKMLVGTNTSVAIIASANALIIKATPGNITDIRKTIEIVDQPRQQVFIEAKFVELNDQAIKDIGIDWQSLQGVTLGAGSLAANLTQTRTTTQSRDANSAQSDQRVHADGSIAYGLDGSGLTAQGPSTFSAGAVGGASKVTMGAPQPAGNAGRVTMDTINQGRTVDLAIQDASSVALNDVRTAILTASDFNIVLSALKQNIGAAIVSNPRLLVSSGQQATIHVGEDRPYAKKSVTQQGTGGSSAQSEIDTIKTGVELQVTPTVNQSTNITLRIKPRLSRVTGTVTIDGNEVPILTTRDVESEFNLDSGRTVAIGGLTTASDQQKVSKIPLLGDIPLIGKYLFSHTHTEKIQDEVIIFVSVGVVRANSIKDNEGIPSGGLLIHRYQLKAAAEEAEAKEALAAEKQRLDDAEKKRLDDAKHKKGASGRKSLFE